jgi:hypothetical protein
VAQPYTCMFDVIDEFLFSADADTISVGPVRLAACRPVDAGHDIRWADAIVYVLADSEDEARMLAVERLNRAVAVLDYAMFRGVAVDRSPSSEGECSVAPRWDLLDGHPIRRNSGGRKPPERCIRMWRDRQPQRTPLNGPRISGRTVAIDIDSNHVPDLIEMVFPIDRASGLSKRQKTLYSAIFAAVDQLHKSIRHDIYSEGRELARLRSITGLEALFTESGANSTSSTASAVGYGAAFASIVCQTETERLDRWNRVRELYGTWSSIVHGSKTDEPAEQDVLDARKVLADSIEACIVWSEAIATVGLQEWITRRRFGCSPLPAVPAQG